MKSFDLCMRPRSLRDAAELAGLAAYTGVGGVALEVDDRLWPEARRAFEDAGLEVLRRVTVTARRAGEVTSLAHEARRRGYDIVAVEPLSDEAARYAARDHNVDLVVYRPGLGRLIDASEAALLRMGGGAVELQARLAEREGGLRYAMVAARRATAYNVPLVVSTCASNTYEYTPPRGLEALLRVLGVPGNYAKAFVYSYPWRVARRRRR